MKKIIITQTNTIYVGDIHGEFSKFFYDIKLQGIIDSVIICLGDIGMGFHKENYYLTEFEKHTKLLKKTNNMVIFFRGNHDDPSWFDGTKPYTFDRIILASDYTVLEQHGIKSLIVGGGLSIDRIYRNSKFHGSHLESRPSYWENELIVLTDEIRKTLSKLTDINILLTHMAPTGVYPYTKTGIDFFIKEDPSIIDEDTIQRKLLSEIYMILQKNNNITHWYSGHYHENKYIRIDGTHYNCIESNKFLHEIFR